jgi:hypothetical protein
MMPPSCAPALTATLLAATFLGGQPPPSAPPQIDRIRAERRTADIRAEGRLVRAGGRTPAVTRRFTWKVKAFPGTLKVLFVITAPPADRLGVLIVVPEGARQTLGIVRRESEAVETVAADHWGDPLFDTGVSFEDLLDGHYDWGRQTYVGTKVLGSRLCDVVRSEPAADDASAYSSAVSWIARDLAVPLYVEKVDSRTGRTKRFTYSGIRRSKGVWGARQVEVRTEGVPEPTFLILSGGSTRAKLSEGDFDPARLWRQREDRPGGPTWPGSN